MPTTGSRATTMTRYLLAVLAPGVLLSGTGPASGQAPAPGGDPIRNVLFIMGDDHAAYALGAYGSRIAHTPNLDRLAAQGVRFDRAYVNSPVCSPSRQSILTGRLPHAAGVTLLFTPFSKEQVTIADHLLARGFRTAAIGKMHFNPDPETALRRGFPEEVARNADDHHGFEYRVDRADYRRHLAANPPRPLPPGTEVRPEQSGFAYPLNLWNAATLPGPVREEESEARFFADRAIEFMERNRDGRFVLWLSFNEPHAPFNFPLEDAGRYRAADMPLPRVGPEDERWIPEIFRGFTEDQMRGSIAAYYASVAHLDRNVGHVLDALDRTGLSDSTLVVYVGDHGYLLGHHGRLEKHSMWEEAVRAPLIMHHPRRLGTGRSTDALVELIDLVPTILDLLGAPPMEMVQGRSLLPLLDGQVNRHRNSVFSEFLADNKAMVRTEDWKYVFTSGQADLAMGYETGLPAPGPTHWLYDLRGDPGEFTSLADDPGYAPLLRNLQRMMLERFRATHPQAAEVPDGLSPEEALIRFLQPPDPAGAHVPSR